ncbi:MAG TPA: ATP-binding protein [Ramlibacter sp.]|nr:ATP-binding protein [Ramlibacter sp.]
MKSPATVRLRLVALVLAFMVPTVGAAILAIAYVYQQERRSFERTLVEATRALALAVDRELARRESVLRTLAAAPSLAADDLRRFDVHARRIAASADATVVLREPGGRVLLDTRRPDGEALPAGAPPVTSRATDPQAARVSDLFTDPVSGTHAFAVELPVMRDGRIAYHLGLHGTATQLQRLLEQQRLPGGWVGTLVDGEGKVVARTLHPERHVNRKPPAELLQRVEQAPDRVARLPSMDGEALVASFSRLGGHGWGSFIGVPEAQITSPARTAAGFGIVAALLLGGSLWAALRVGQRLVQPITRLAGFAEALGRGQSVAMHDTGLEETDRVARALAQASESIHSSNQLLEHRVQQALDEAEKAHRAVVQNQRLEAIGQLTGGVAHDFNNLLMVVNTNVHLLRARNPVLADDPQLVRIDRAVATGSKLTRQLLAFARRQPLRPQVIDLGQVLPELMDLIRPSLSAKVKGHCEVEPGTACVSVDPAEFELAIINLAVNAKDAMPEGGSLTLRAANTQADELGGRPGVRIDVTDTGHGIPPEIVDKVFEPFFTTKEVGRGTGLGLSQVYALADQAGGTARIRSGLGQGTTVSVLLPAAERGVERDATPAGVVNERLDCEVLLVEDNGELAQAGRELLTQAGCRVRHVATGEDALAALRQGPAPQVVLTDIRMPGGVDGLALARRVREEWPRVQVVLMTGYTAELGAARAAGLDVLSKPASPEQLLGAIAAAQARAREAAAA